IDVVQTVILTHHGWWWIVTTYGDPSRFDEVIWSAPCIPFLAGLTTAIVQIFYAWRIWTLTTNIFMHGLSILIVLIALLQSLIAMVSGLIVSQNPLLSTLQSLDNEFATWLAGSFADDTIITICMIYILSQAKNRTSWGASETMLTKLINRIIQTGAATMVLTAIDLAIFLQIPDTNYYYVP
ncbi:hypothetical protein B0H19DRAFT_952166, partial [Mycena capillaripes]